MIIVVANDMIPTHYNTEVMHYFIVKLIAMQINVAKLILCGHNLNAYICTAPYMHMQVPTGHVWLEGDNRSSSYDSRDFGPVPLALVHSRVFFRVSFLCL